MHKWGSPRLKINKSGSPRLGTTSVGRTVLPTTYGLQQFAKIRAVKVDYFDFPGEIFEKFV